MKLGIAAEEMRGLIATVTNPVGAPVRTSCRLPLLRTVIALTARGGGMPGDTIPDFERRSGPVLFEPGAQSFDAPNRFMAEDHGQRDRQLSFPQMHVRPADAGHGGAHQCSARLEPFGN